jgi:hypothetical protein
MTELNLPSSTIKKIVDDPTLLGARLTSVTNSTSDPLSALGISPDAADHILAGYNSGFRAVFIMNATLAAIATVVSILMIKHKELTRGDEAQLRAQAEKEEKEESEKDGQGDIEMGTLHAQDEEGDHKESALTSHDRS